MSLFGADRPKGITQEEFRYIKGELMNAPMGHSDAKLLDRQIEEIMNRLTLLLDPRTTLEQKNNWKQVDQNEVSELEGEFDHDTALHLTAPQTAHVKEVLQKYVDIDKHGGMFSL
jgi:hypothetical protein